jgi:hypothetical protein
MPQRIDPERTVDEAACDPLDAGMAAAFGPDSGPPPPAAGSVVLAHSADPVQPHATDPDRTTPEVPQPAPGEPPYPTVPGYEIIGELGRGGMGVVYRARQTALKRVVALKMVLSGDRASPQELARFRREAEAVARLRHANIVQVHEVGAYDGRPFFSLEFVDGGTLATRLRDGLPDPKDAAALAEKLARAMHAVHRCHVVHRDLKPANVLLTADGTPKITDFGLAKKLDEDTGHTHSGAVMGTPSYMAPEQASGGAARTTPRADVYALGAILYECLTGRPPFRAATVAQTLRQVIEDEPVAPRRLSPAVPRDLETICLMCLRKDPARRYPTANDLAEDLRRLLALEPIQARPVGRAERAAKWARRNRALTAALIVFTLAVLISAALAVWATRLGTDLQESNQKLGEAESQRTVQKWLAPQGLQAGTDVSLLDGEVEALWDMAGTQEDPLRILFVQEAIREPATTRQLSNRRAFALHAAVGLSQRRRGAVERVLVERLQAEGIPAGQQTDLALALAALGGLSAEAASRAGPVITRRMSEEKSPDELRTLAEALPAVAARLDAKDAAPAAATLLQAMNDAEDRLVLRELARSLPVVAARLEPGDAVNTLLRAMRGVKDPAALSSLAGGLSAAAARLEPGDAINTLLQAMRDAKDSSTVNSLAPGLPAVAARVGPKDAAPVATLLAQAMKDPQNGIALQGLAQGLKAVAAHLDAQDAAPVATTLAQAMKDAKDLFGVSASPALRSLGEGLSEVAARLEPGDAVNTLLQAMRDAKDPDALHLLGECLSAVAASVRPEDAGPVATTLVQAMKAAKQGFALQGLKAVAARVRPEDAAPVATALVEAMKNAEYPFPLRQGMAQGLKAVAARLDAKDAAQAANTLVAAMKDVKNPSTLDPLALGLSAVAARLDAKDAAPVANTLLQAMRDARDRFALFAWQAMLSLGQGLSAVAARLDAKDAAPVANTLLQAMRDAKDPGTLGPLAGSLSAVAARLESKDAATVTAQAAILLAQAMKDRNNVFAMQGSAMQGVAQGLKAVAARLDAQDAARIANTILQAINETNNPIASSWLGEGLSAVAARLDAKDAGPVATALVEAMTDPKRTFTLRQGLAQGLKAVAARLDAKDAAQAANTLAQAMKVAQDPGTLQLGECLSAVAARLDAKDAGPIATTLVEAMKDPKNRFAMQGLAQGLKAVAARLDAKDAAQAATTLAEDMKVAQDPVALPWLREDLSAVAQRLDAKDAAQLANTLLQAMRHAEDPTSLSLLPAVADRLDAKDAGAVATALVEAMTDPKRPITLRQGLAQGLKAVATHMEPKDAARAATTLAQAMKDTDNRLTLDSLSTGLSSLAAGMEPKHAVILLMQVMEDTQDSAVPAALTRLPSLAEGLSAAAARLEPGDAAHVATTLVRAISQARTPERRGQFADGLVAVLTRDAQSGQRQAGATTVTTRTPFGLAQEPLPPLPPPLPARDLVDLLKHPLSVGKARRIVLDQLSRHYERSFADVWEFVDSAEQQRLGLDLTTPPRRPE